MIDASRISEILKDCLFKEGEDTDAAVVGEGITRNFGFHPKRLKGYHAEVSEMLLQLPEEFHYNGWSFLNACVDRDGNQWGDHPNVEELFALGQAMGMVVCPVPRELWSLFPGGMPYYTVKAGGEIEVQPPIVPM
jgi:hypothetical protein